MSVENHKEGSAVKFYNSIVDYYDDIFPLNNAQVEFVKKQFTNSYRAKNILEVGCGTGSLTIALGEVFGKVDGIDLDNLMLLKANEKLKESKVNNISFKNLNMLNLAGEYEKKHMDGIVCFGNTLVHLKNSDEIYDFLIDVKKIIKHNGKLMIQIINYDRIINENIDYLPTIENDQIKFERNYSYDSKRNIVDFSTKLTVKKDKLVVANTVSLYAAGKDEIEKILKNAGFKNIKFYGDFKMNPLEKGSIPLIVTCNN